MAMNGDTLGDAIKAAIDSAVSGSPPASEAQRVAIFRALGNAIVDHITSNAQLTFRVTDAGIQRADVGSVPNTPTLPPTPAVTLPSGQIS